MIPPRITAARSFALLLCGGVLVADDTFCSGALSGRFDKIIVPEGAVCVLTNARVDGDVEVKPNGALSVSGRTRVGGNIQSDGGRFVRIEGPRVIIPGDVQIKKAWEASGFQSGAQIHGNFQYEENSGFLTGHDSVIRGNFQMFKNTGGASLTGNTIRQNMQCKENSPHPAGGNNAVRGSKEDQCSEL